MPPSTRTGYRVMNVFNPSRFKEAWFMLFMVIEHFKPGRAPAVYRRFRDKGRMAPEGVLYHSSWVDLEFHRCFQVMEAENEDKVREWTANWEDLVDFEIIPVRTSAEAAAAIASHPTSRQAPSRRR